MENDLTVQQAAERTGLSEHTLRYYERIGLLARAPRAGNGHRRYSGEDIGWIQFVKKLRAAGMPIAAVRRYVELQRQGSGTLGERLALLREHRRAVAQQIDELSAHLAVIEGKIAYYAQLADANDDCAQEIINPEDRGRG